MPAVSDSVKRGQRTNHVQKCPSKSTVEDKLLKTSNLKLVEAAGVEPDTRAENAQVTDSGNARSGMISEIAKSASTVTVRSLPRMTTTPSLHFRMLFRRNRAVRSSLAVFHNSAVKDAAPTACRLFQVTRPALNGGIAWSVVSRLCNAARYGRVSITLLYRYIYPYTMQFMSRGL